MNRNPSNDYYGNSVVTPTQSVALEFFIRCISIFQFHVKKNQTRSSITLTEKLNIEKWYFSLHMHAKPSFAHRLQTVKMRHKSTSLNAGAYDLHVHVTDFNI